MIPAGFAGVETMLATAMVASIRPGAAFIAAPIFGANAVPVQLRLVVALGLAMPMMGRSGAVTPDALLSLAGLLMVVQEIVIGVAIGSACQIAYAAALMAGETIGNAMGLGFAVMVDPLTSQQSNAVSQWMGVVATLIFLAVDGHLLLAATIAESYRALPVGGGLPGDFAEPVIALGSMLFAAGVAIAIPVASAILLVQLCFAMLSRTAPQLNLFAVGLPASLMAGLLLFAIALPAMGDAIGGVTEKSLDRAAAIAEASP